MDKKLHNQSLRKDILKLIKQSDLKYKSSKYTTILIKYKNYNNDDINEITKIVK